MARIRPFRALRPSVQMAETVAALPYDVYDRAEARAVVEKNTQSFLAIDRAETQFPPETDIYAPCIYEKAAAMIADWTQKGIFVQEEEPCYFIWELTMDGRAQTGLVACSAVDDYLDGVILKHENTRKEKEADRFRHIDICSCQTGPIFLAYRADPEITGIIRSVKEQAALYDFTAEDGISHRVWRVADPETIRLLTDAAEGLPHTYIADGHHRAASAVSVSRKRREEHPDYTGEEEFNYVLSVLFPDEELRIIDYNRVLKDLNGHTPEEILAMLAEVFDVTPAGGQVCPSVKGEMGFFLTDEDGKGSWYLMKEKPELVRDDPVEALDVAYLQREALTPIWGIGDPREDKRIDFVGGIRGLSELERRCHTDCRAAFAMYPTSIAELFAVADAGLLMPPKSTWFEPKLRSGLFLHKIEK